MDDTRFKAHRELCERRMEALLPPATQRPEDLHAAMRYSALAPGKRLRPMLVMASSEAVGGSPEAVVDAACAVELVHCFSLIHDDLPAIDDDDLRRGRPTCHKQYGEAIAILAGDALFALAFRALASGGSLKAVELLAEASGSDGLVGGEVVDVVTEGKAFTAEDLEFIHVRKTGVLIRACCEIGGLLGGGSAADVGRLRAFGEKIGLAFQIADDVLNETSSPDQLGKATRSDALRQKATYPALYGLEGAQKAARAKVEEALGELDSLEAEALRALAWFAVERLH